MGVSIRTILLVLSIFALVLVVLQFQFNISSSETFSKIILYVKKNTTATDLPKNITDLESGDNITVSEIIVDSKTTKPTENLDGETCHVPHFNPWDPEVVAHAQKPTDELVCTNSQPELTYLSHDEKLIFNETLLQNQSYENFSCHYRCILREEFGDRSWFYGGWVPVNLTENDTKIECEFIQVECYDNSTSVYNNLHAQIIVNETKLDELERILPNNISSTFPNVILLVFDSTSYLNFQRMCPKSMKVLKTLYNSTFFESFTKVGDNSFPNAMALLAGKYWGNFSHERIYHTYYDPFDIVWKRYAAAGYATFFSEDEPSMNVFLYLKKGFRRQPTDHRLRVFMMACEEHPACRGLCLSNRKLHNVMLEYLHQFLVKYPPNRPKFALLWFIGMVHNYIDKIAYADEDFATFLTDHYSLLKESFVFVLGDHGQRFTSIRNTKIGRYEDAMPLFSMALPESLRSDPVLQGILQHNSQLLASFYDGYITLRDILESSQNSWGDMNQQRNWSFVDTHFPESQSLLRPLRTDRNCDEIGIEEEFCTCQQFSKIYPNSTEYLAIGTALLEHVNALFKERSECAKLTLNRTVNAQVMSHNKQAAKKNFMKSQKYRVTIETAPSGALFEALLNLEDKNKFRVVGDVARINKYGNQSACIKDDILRKYCYCIK